MGALEVGLAAQVQCVEESMSEIKLQGLWAEGDLREQATVAQVEAQMGVRERDLKGLVAGEQVQQVEEQVGKISVDVRGSKFRGLEIPRRRRHGVP